MKICPVLAGALLALAIFAFESSATGSIERSVSPSEQFIIYGGDAVWRGAFSTLAERTKANLLAVLQRRDEWTTAIVINLQPRSANLPEMPGTALRFSQTGSGLKLELDLAISREPNSGAMERELLRPILLEMIYRNQPAIASGQRYVEPPDWLMDGLLASVPNQDRTALMDALAVSERIPSLKEFLRERPELLDPAGRLLYRAHSFALVQLLLESADGHARLGRYIDNLSFASNDPLADLQAAFPQFADGEFEKIWKSKIANFKSSEPTDLLGFAQTEEKLAALLETRFPSLEGRDKSLSLEEVCHKKLNSMQRMALQQFGQTLMLLGAQANPVLRPIIQDYVQIAAQLALKKNRRAALRLAELKTLRAKLTARMTEVDDYLNWFEATQLSTQSGLFDDYLKTSTDSADLRTRKKDSLSAYLDAMEAEF